MDLDLAAVDHLLTTPRAVRRRLDLDRPVQMDVVMTCLELALQAPTAGDAENWHWVAITNPVQRAAIAELPAASGTP